MARLPDRVEIQLVGPDSAGILNNFTSFQITNDLTMPSEAAFELGNDGTWSAVQPYIAHGIVYKVFVNDRLRLTGRVEMDDIPVDVDGGSVVRFTVRTKAADAAFASADQKVRVRDTSIRDFILALYRPLGYTAGDFVFDAYTARDLLTGVDSSGHRPPVDLERIKLDEAKVNPPETIFEAADRHLRRHGLMHWDSPDGKIVVGKPNDSQAPLYELRCNRLTNTGANNVEGLTRTMDYSGIPSYVAVYGVGGRGGSARTRIGAYAVDFDVHNAGFHRPVLVVAEGIKTVTWAERAAARELSARSKNKDGLEIQCDGLSYWNGSECIPWAVDAVATVDSDVAGGQLGAYFIHRVVLQRDAAGGDKTNLNALRKGVWQI